MTISWSGEADGFAHALHARAGDQQFIGRRVLRHLLPHGVFLFRRQHHAFTRRAHYHVAAQRREVPLLHVVLDLADVNVPLVIEGGGNGWENTLQLHGSQEVLQ